MKIGFPNNPRKNILEEIEWIGENQFKDDNLQQFKYYTLEKSI